MMEDDQPPKKQAEKDLEDKQQLQEYDTFLYKFQQQIIDAWKPVPYTSNNVILYAVLSAVCIGLGLGLILTAPTTPEIEKRYDNQCTNSACSVTFQLSEKLSSPVYFYYGLTNYYQNHRQYIRYFSATQLEDGQKISTTAAKTACGSDMYTNGQHGYTTSSTNTSLSQGSVAWPCGPRAKSYYEIRPQLQTFKLKNSNGDEISWQRDNIAWPHDIGLHQNWDLSQQAFDVTEEDWLIWFRPAAMNSFFKLYARIQSDLPADNYTFTCTESFDSSAFDGKKYIHLSKSNFVGNKDLFLGIAFLALGGGCLVLLIIFIAKCVTQRRERPKTD